MGQNLRELLQKGLGANSLRGRIRHLWPQFFQLLRWRRESPAREQFWARELEAGRKAEWVIHWYWVFRAGRDRRELDSSSPEKRTSQRQLLYFAVGRKPRYWKQTSIQKGIKALYLQTLEHEGQKRAFQNSFSKNNYAIAAFYDHVQKKQHS